MVTGERSIKLLGNAIKSPRDRWETQMTGHGTKFGRKKEEAIAALLSQRTLEEAARTVGISPKTLTRWLKLPVFQEAYRQARRAACTQSGARLQQASSAAVSTILKIMVDTNGPAACRLRAAATVVNLAFRALEIEDLEVRLTKLEQAVEQSKSNRSME